MNRIERTLGGLRESGEGGLMPFVCGGWPTVESTEAVLPALSEAGASVIEVGIPFSDPIADGPTIASAMHRALESGVRPSDVFGAVSMARAATEAGIVAMVSVSIVQRLGGGTFARAAREAGFDGVIIPDAPVDEAAGVLEPIRAEGLTGSLLVAPTTPPDRAERIVAACSGFVYLLARVGITGEDAPGGGADDAERLAVNVASLRSMTDLPVACGFGIGSPEQVRAVVRDAGADAAIVGSALVRRMTEAADAGEDAVEAARRFAAELASGLAPA